MIGRLIFWNYDNCGRENTSAQRIDVKWAATIGRAVLLFVSLRLLLPLLPLIVTQLFPLAPPCTAAAPTPVLHSSGIGFPLLGVWQRADACSYEWIATIGYPSKDERGGEVAAFFPLYPALMHLVGALFRLNFTISGFVVSGLAYIAAIIGLYRLVCDEYDEEIAQRTVLYLSIFPSAFFLFAPFTESLFLALVVWTLAFARRGVWGWAALLAFGCGLTRAQGCLLVLPLAWELLQQWRSGHRKWRTLAVPPLPVLGLVAVTIYTWVTTGWTAFEVQQRWSSGLSLPWNLIIASWRYVLARGNVVEAINLGLFVLFSGLVIVGLRKIPFTYALYVLPQLLLIATRNPFHTPLISTSRYVLVGRLACA